MKKTVLSYLGAALVLLTSCSSFSVAGFSNGQANTEYRPGTAKFDKVWTKFYNGDHEEELSDPLIHAGRAMTAPICEAIAHKDMKYRRYAIGALGQTGDPSAIPQLESILKNITEQDYFRADALKSIHQINPTLGATYAKKYQRGPGLLGSTATEING